MDAPAVIVAVAALVAAVTLVRLVDPAWFISLGIAASVFSGHWDLLGIPLGVDRLALVAGVGALLLRIGPARDRPRIRLDGRHWLLLAAALFALCSAMWAGSLEEVDGRFRLLDAFALTAFVLFAVAPVAFVTDHQRRILLGFLVALGAYLSWTALAETLGVDALVVPKYILDPEFGIHADRARGPFLEAAGNGLALVFCAVAAVLGTRTFTTPATRSAALLVAVACVAALPGTYTRSAWIAGVVALVVLLLGVAELRAWALPALATAALGLMLAIAVIPGFGDRLDERAGDRGPVHVRENTNAAAVHMIEHDPLTGVGWNRFVAASADHFRITGDTPPRAGFGEPAHNVFLSRAAELGLVGATLWLLAVLAAIGGAVVAGRRDLRLWRVGLLALALAWTVVAMLGPADYAFPLLVLFTWAGAIARA